MHTLDPGLRSGGALFDHGLLDVINHSLFERGPGATLPLPQESCAEYHLTLLVHFLYRQIDLEYRFFAARNNRECYVLPVGSDAKKCEVDRRLSCSFRGLRAETG